VRGGNNDRCLVKALDYESRSDWFWAVVSAVRHEHDETTPNVIDVPHLIPFESWIL